MAGQAIAIDLGGTKTSWARLDESYRIIESSRTDTPETAAEIIDRLSEIVRGCAVAAPGAAGIGIAVAGLVDSATGTIVASPNLPLDGVNLAAELADKTNLPCHIDNDANLAVLGEVCIGAGRDKQTFIGLTIGTGIGGGIISAGRLWRGAHGTAAEFGHIIVDPGGIKCPCGALGCWEMRASGSALVRMGRERVAAEPASELARRFDGDPERVGGLELAGAARDGDKAALELFAELGHWLGVGIGSLINALNPEAVIMGGGVASSLDLAIDAVKAEVAAIAVDPRAKTTPLLISKLDNTAGLIGAAALVFGR